ncbi:MAG: tetratricopeptide repeat protein [Burkholderiales bacterium]|nr:tetratricopeptide repeat protein [Burkholderiales bacterium]
MKTKRASLGKTTRPRLSGILPREGLFSQFDEARKRPVIWVSGPPGCGKTTAIASYLDQAGIDCLWYQLDEGDADVATFFYYLGLAAAELAAAPGKPLPLLAPEYQAGLGVFTRRYFQEFYAGLKTPFAVVFDGYHDVPLFSQFHAMMREALAELPRGGCAMLISRGEPPPEFARLRANRTVATLGWDELRLTREESDRIALRRRPQLGRDALDALYAKTQGWAAGLVLMIEQSTISGSITEPPQLSTRQLVFDYLAGEIFQKTDAGTQELLLRTAYLTQMTADMAEELSGDARARHILADLYRRNYFVDLRQAGAEPVYQFHPMFREFLLARVQEAHSRDRRRQLQKMSAALMERAGQIEEAFALYRESHDWDEMARLIAVHAQILLRQGRGETLARWVEDLPPEVRDGRPWTVYWAASSRAQLAPREARVLHAKAFELFHAQSPADLTGMVLAASGAMDAILFELDDFSLLDRWIAVVDEAEKGGVQYPSPEVEARVACSMVFSLTLRLPHRRDLEAWVERALARAHGASDPNLTIFVGLLCALTVMWAGFHAKASALIEETRRLSGSPDVSPFSRLTLKNVEAMYFMLAAEREPCRKATLKGLEIARTTGVNTWTFQLLVYAYGSALASGELDSAAVVAQQLEPHLAGAGRFNLCLYHHFQAWEAMLRKDLMRALQQERVALNMAVEVGCPYFEVLCRLALAEILAECGDERKCMVHLHQLRPMVEGIDNRHLEFTCLIGVGRLALDHDRQQVGLNALRRGLAIGREYGYTHFLWWRPGAMSRVCAHALEAGIEPDYVKNLIKQRDLTPEPALLSVQDWPWTFRVYTLGNFQLLKHDSALASTSGKAQRRPLEMLKVLIACGGERVSEDRITEALWPRIDGDSAHRSFTSTLHRLRKLLGEDRAIVLHEGRLTLVRRYVWVDALAFDELVAEVDALHKRVGQRPDFAQLGRLAEGLLGLYRGPFMASEPDEAWYLERRERTRGRFIRALTAIGHFWEQAGQPDQALECYERCLEADPAAEGFYRHLILCYERLGRRAEAIEAYHRCRNALALLEIEPSPETRTLYEKLA